MKKETNILIVTITGEQTNNTRIVLIASITIISGN